MEKKKIIRSIEKLLNKYGTAEEQLFITDLILLNLKDIHKEWEEYLSKRLHPALFRHIKESFIVSESEDAG